MKKLLLLVTAFVFMNNVMSQDIDDVKKFAYLGQHAKAKEAVDKYLAVEKNAKKAEGWFYKGYTYNMLSKDSTFSMDQSSNLKMEAFAALKKYRELDPKNELMEEQSNSPLFDMYSAYASDLGIKAYNNKDLAKAAEYFAKALDVHDYIYSNNLAGSGGFKFSALDTTLTLYTAIAYAEAKQADPAAVYYKKMVDANIGGEQYIDVYQQLADYYKNKKDHELLISLLQKASTIYPANNDYWVALEIEDAIDGIAKPAVFEKYESLLLKYPSNYTIPYNYGVELYHYVYSEEMKTTNTTAFKTKLKEIIKKAIAIKSTSESNFLMANFLYNYSIDISDEARKLKGPKPEDLKKKKELNDQSTAVMNEAIPYAEKTVELFASIAKPKSSEKINYRQSLTILRNIYETKKDMTKAAQYDKLIKEIQ